MTSGHFGGHGRVHRVGWRYGDSAMFQLLRASCISSDYSAAAAPILQLNARQQVLQLLTKFSNNDEPQQLIAGCYRQHISSMDTTAGLTEVRSRSETCRCLNHVVFMALPWIDSGVKSLTLGWFRGSSGIGANSARFPLQHVVMTTRAGKYIVVCDRSALMPYPACWALHQMVEHPKWHSN